MARQGAIVRRPIESRIVIIRGEKVLLDNDLAELYGVTVKRLNEQVKRNAARFPADFLFQLKEEEHQGLRSQIATSKKGRGGRRYRPYAFTEHGAIMAANVLNSPRAVEMSVLVVRAFVRLREILSANKEMASKVMELERRLGAQSDTITRILAAIKQLMQPQTKHARQIGFLAAPKRETATQMKSRLKRNS